MHFCQDELYALLMVLPGASLVGAWMRAKWASIFTSTVDVDPSS